MKSIQIASSFLVIAAVMALMVTATTATFTDQATSTGNTFTAGTLFMSVDGACAGREYGGGGAGGAGVDGNTGCAVGTAFSAGPLKPGDPATSHTFTVVNEGSLPGTLTAAVNAEVDAGHPACDPATYLTLTPAGLSATPLAAEASHELEVSAALNEEAPNACQGAEFTVTVVFDLVQ